ncbi:MAG TPA: DJ-1/PfpI family protein [Candidatus Mediterraneibacter merdipullorum]|nr:DJ-1/PfpI family protein [Candidatus Mediterraneibacter merdipullorum]
MKKVYVFLADGFEEIEGLTVVDILRRAGVETVTVSVMGRKDVMGSHAIPVRADMVFEEADMSDADMLVLPGGMPGTIHLKEHEGLRKLLGDAHSRGVHLAAICAAPTVLGDLGFLREKKACCYPSFEEQLDCAQVCRVPVVTDGDVTTGRGMGAAIPFALELTGILCGEEKAGEVKAGIVYEG